MKVFKIFEAIYKLLPTLSCDTIEELQALLAAPEYVARVNKLRLRFAAGENVDKEKAQLYNFVADGVLTEGFEFKKENITPVRNNFIDLDHINSDDDYNLIKNCLLVNAKELNLLFVQRGPRDIEGHHSLHIVFKQLQVLPGVTGEAYIQAQQILFVDKACKLIGSDVIRQYVDPCVKHYGRRVYLTDWNSIIFISRRFIDSYKDIDPFLKGDAKVVSVNGTNLTSSIVPKEAIYEGLTLNQIAKQMARDRWGDSLDPGKGMRHAGLLEIVNRLSAITYDERELKGAVEGLFGDHDENDVDLVCRDAIGFHAKAKSNELIGAVRKLKGKGIQSAATSAATTQTATTSVATTSTTTSSTTPQQSSALLNTQGSLMPQQMPAGFKVFVSIFPEDYREMACNMLLGSLQLYCSAFETVGANGDAEPIVLNTCAIAGFGGGKTAIMRQITRYITDRVEKSDELERQKLEQWRQQKVQKNGTGTLSAQPTPRVRIFSNASRTQILGYAVNSNGLCQVIMTDELQPLAQYEKKNSFASLSELLRQGFNNGVVRNDTASAASVNCSCHVKIGSCTATQASYVYDFYGDGLDGLPSRVLFHIQPDIISATVQPFKFPDAAAEQSINDMIDVLEQTSGMFDLKQTKKCLAGWYENIVKEYEAEKAKDENADPTKVLLAGRCCQTALRVATIMYSLNGQKEGKMVEDWALYVAEKSLKALWILYADKLSQNKINASINEKVNQYKAKDTNKNILSHLADSFDVNDMMNALQAEGLACASQNASNKITQLLKAKLIEKKGKGKWRKSIIGK